MFRRIMNSNKHFTIKHGRLRDSQSNSIHIQISFEYSNKNNYDKNNSYYE